ncbi:hypothetical protein [Candidatus Laterigemmans baculatus]|uniref:hypothetical protein n=1 Tax=Candidatus Laterigemmans baculatus TaxID=2770505 RepID=UPI0013DB2A20|nr:hypothetical protein [Candidatus Laterigemmans baculatus]
MEIQGGHHAGELRRQAGIEEDALPPTPARIERVAPLRGGAVLRWESDGEDVFVLGSHGGPVAAPKAVEPLADLAALKERVPTESPVGYRGCDRAYHYFCVPAGNGYRLPRRAWAVTTMPVTLGFCIPLVFAGERLVIPSREWSSRLDLPSLQWILDP